MSARPETNRRSPTKKILVVDDTPDFLAIVAMLLENQHYKAYLRSGGRDAVHAVKRQHPDLVILDVMLPDVDGLEVLRRLKADPATHDVPVIICSADRERVRSRRRELAPLVAGILEKPVDLDDLLGAVRRAVGDSA